MGHYIKKLVILFMISAFGIFTYANALTTMDGDIELKPTVGSIDFSTITITSNKVGFYNVQDMYNDGYRTEDGKFAMKLFNYGSGTGLLDVYPKPNDFEILANQGATVSLENNHFIRTGDATYATVLAIWDEIPTELTYECDDYCLASPIGTPIGIKDSADYEVEANTTTNPPISENNDSIPTQPGDENNDSIPIDPTNPGDEGNVSIPYIDETPGECSTLQDGNPNMMDPDCLNENNDSMPIDPTTPGTDINDTVTNPGGEGTTCSAGQIDIMGQCVDINHPTEFPSGNFVEPLLSETGPDFTQLSTCAIISNGSISLKERNSDLEVENLTINYAYDKDSGKVTFTDDKGSETLEIHSQIMSIDGQNQALTLFFIKQDTMGSMIDFVIVQQDANFVCDESKLVYVEKFDNNPYNPNDGMYQQNYPITISGTVNLPEEVQNDPYSYSWLSVEKIGPNSFWNSTEITKDGTSSTYTVGVNETGKYKLVLNISGGSFYEEFIYDANGSKWVSRNSIQDEDPVDENGNIVDDEDPNFDWSKSYYSYVPAGIELLNVTENNATGIDFDYSIFEANVNKVNFSVKTSNDFEISELCKNNEGDIGTCSWSGGDQDYQYWIGRNGIRISLLDAETGMFMQDKEVKSTSKTSIADGSLYSATIKPSVSGKFIVKVNVESFDSEKGFSNWEEYYFNPTSGKLISQSLVDYSNNNAGYGIPNLQTVGFIELSEGQKELNVSSVIDFVALEADTVKLTGSVEFDDDTKNVNMEIINLQNGNSFGWKWFDENSISKDYSIKLPGNGKYIIRVSRETLDGFWEGYLIDLTNISNPKFIQEQNIMWKDYIKNSDGTFTAIDSIEDFEWGVEPTYWLPDLSLVTPLDVTDASSEYSANISFESLATQSIVIEGNITLPSTFTPGQVCKLSSGNIGYEQECWNDMNAQWLGYNNVNFQVINADDGNQVNWSEIKKDSVGSDNNGNKIFTYKLKVQNEGSYIVRANFEMYDEMLGLSNWNGYFIDFLNNTLVSEKKVYQKPVLDESKYLPNYSADKCWNEGKFWWEEPIETQTEQEDTIFKSNGKCYSEYPMWIPDFDGVIELSENEKVSHNLDFTAISNNQYKITGEITMPESFIPNHDWNNLSNIRVEVLSATDGRWLGDGHIQFEDKKNEDSYKYAISLDDVQAGDMIIIKLVKESNKNGQWTGESFFLNIEGDNISFISENSIEWVEKQVSGQTWSNFVPSSEQVSPIVLSDLKSITLDIDYEGKLQEYENNKISLYGTIKTTEAIKLGYTDYGWNSIRINAIDKATGEYIPGVEVYGSDECFESACNEFNFELEFASSGEYIIQISKELSGQWESIYYNFGSDHNVSNDDKIINQNKVQWINSANNFGMPNPEQAGYIVLNEKTELNIDFEKFEGSQVVLSGAIKVEDNFDTTDYCTNASEEVGPCEWTQSGLKGYFNWYGNKNIRVEALSKVNGEMLDSVDLKVKDEESGYYNFKLKVGNLDEVGNEFILRVSKSENFANQWKNDDIFYNFGEDNKYSSDDSLVNGKRVDWINTNSDSSNNLGYHTMIPNPDKTGWIETEVSVNDIFIDLTTFGNNDFYLNGTVTFKSDFNLSDENSFADVSVIDSKTGMWIANAPIENNGSYEINLGEVSGDYIIQVNYSHNDFNNPQNNWWKNKILDFNGLNFEVINGYEVIWEPIIDESTLHASIIKPSNCFSKGFFWYEEKQKCYDQPINWIPNVGTLTIDDNVVTTVDGKKVYSGLNIDLASSSGKTIAVSISGIPSNVQWPYLFVANPYTFTNKWVELQYDSTTGNYLAKADELKVGQKYTIEFGYNIGDKYYNFFVKDDNDNLTDGTQAISRNEVFWIEIDETTKLAGPDPDSVSYIELTSDLNISVSKPSIVLNSFKGTLNGAETDKDISVNFRSETKPYGRYEMYTADSNGEISFSFDDVKVPDNYLLSFWYDNNEYTYDSQTDKLIKDVMWVAFDKNGVKVCPKDSTNQDWNCKWDEQHLWQWKPNVKAISMDSNKTLNVSLPSLNKVTGKVVLGNEYANSFANINLFQHEGSDNAWTSVFLDENGSGEFALKVNGGDNYRFEIWIDTLGGYTYSSSNGGEWIPSYQSWESGTNNNWGPKASTLISINSNISLSDFSIGSDFIELTINITGLENDGTNISEDIWVNIGEFGEGNMVWSDTNSSYTDTITMKLPAGEYSVSAYPSAHKGGFASDGDSIGNEEVSTFTNLSWNFDAKDKFTLSTENNTMTIELPSTSTLGNISGTVSSSICEGYIEAKRTDGDGSSGIVINSDCSYKIKGLEAGTYDVTYYIWSEGATPLTTTNITVNANQTTENVVIQ